ncbi:hypothetical protein K438DRAFT_1780754 [Mycena galopus ATCC 62051]|nr:hypothetical protein K438DRAFT_1780754 [Mycena galopus ATCC 62051]
MLAVMDANSHHVLWDSRTNTKLRMEDFELHDLLVANPVLPFLLVTPPDIPTHISGSTIDLGFCTPSLFPFIREVIVDPEFCVGSDHLPIRYSFDFNVAHGQSLKFNNDKMDLEKFLALICHELGTKPLPIIETQAQLDAAASLLCKVLWKALEGSTPQCCPCSLAKRWWSPRLMSLLAVRLLVDSARQLWFKARPKQEAWYTFVKDLERIDRYKAVKNLRHLAATAFPVIRDPDTRLIASLHSERGKILGQAWFGAHAAEVATPLPPHVTSDMHADPIGSSTRDKQDHLPASAFTSEARVPLLDDSSPILLAKSIEITNEHTLVEPPDTEINCVILTVLPWKSPDRCGLQMGHVRSAWSEIGDWVHITFKVLVVLGSKPQSRLQGCLILPTSSIRAKAFRSGQQVSSSVHNRFLLYRTPQGGTVIHNLFSLEGDINCKKASRLEGRGAGDAERASESNVLNDVDALWLTLTG